MKVTRDKTENRQAFLTIEMAPPEFEESLEAAYRRLVKKTNVPGFRKGKAPRGMLERYIGRESLLENALNSLIPKACEDAFKEQEIEAFDRPTIEITQTEPLIFKAIVPLPPTVNVGDYHSLRLKPETAASTKNDVASIIDRLHHQQATWEPVEREIGFNDLAVFDIESAVGDKSFINQKGAQYQVIKNYPTPLPGFAEQLVGLKEGEEKKFTLQIPKDYPDKELADKEASFRVRVSEVKQERLPKLDDEFAKGIDPKFETLNSLRKHVANSLKHKAEEKAKRDFEEKVIDAVVNLSEVEFPPLLMEMETSRLIDQQLQHWQKSDHSLDEYLASINKTEDELREELRPAVSKRITRSLVLGKISEQEKIKVRDPEIGAEIEETIKGAAENKKGELKKLLNTPQSYESIKQLLVRRKTIQRLVDIAMGSQKKQKKEGAK